MSCYYAFLQKFPVVIICVCLLGYAHPCLIKFLSPKKNSDRSDYELKQFESKRSKTLDCNCGTIPSPSKYYPWEVVITHVPSSSVPGKFCRGTLVNDRIILTSAYCIMKVSYAEILDKPWKGFFFHQQCYAQPNELRIRITNGNMVGTLELEVADIYANPLFLFQRSAYDKPDYDFALLTLKSPLKVGQSFVPVCLPHSFKLVEDRELEGIKTMFSRWYITDIDNITAISVDQNMYESFIFPRMRCRIITENNWVSDRFLCTLAPSLPEKQSLDFGGALLVKNGDQYSQVGIHSWRTYFPLLYHLTSLSLASNVFGFLEKIEKYSAKMGAQWCKNDWNGLPKIGSMYKSSTIQDPSPYSSDSAPWQQMSSQFRNIRKTCKCGQVNSNSAKARIQGGVDTRPYEYGWQVQLIMHFQESKSKKRQICGGAIINSRIVVTAAHCVLYGPERILVQANDIEVYAHRHKGVAYRDDLSRLIKVEVVIPHPHYRDGHLLENDIALIVLRKSICFTCLQDIVSPLCFPKAGEVLDLDGREDAKVIGWGRTDVFNSSSHAARLQESWAKIVSRDDCIEILSRIYESTYFVKQVKDDSKKICAGNLSPSWNYSDPAKGDSGGPLFLPVTRNSKTVIHVGIASMITMSQSAVRRKDKKTVTFYTRSQSYVDFVDFYSFIVDATWCARSD